MEIDEVYSSDEDISELDDEIIPKEQFINRKKKNMSLKKPVTKGLTIFWDLHFFAIIQEQHVMRVFKVGL